MTRVSDTRARTCVQAPAAPPPRSHRKARKSGFASASQPSDGSTYRPIISVQGGGLSRQATAGERAVLLSGAPVYQRGAALVRPILEEVDAADGRRTKVAQLARIELPYMRDLLS